MVTLPLFKTRTTGQLIKYIVGTVILTTAWYWFVAFFFTLLDYTQKPAFLFKCKTQPKKNVPLDLKKLTQVNIVFLFVFQKYFWLHYTVAF